MIEFKEFPKIARFNREVIITEKLDGTNAQINIRYASDHPFEQGYDVQSEIDGQTVYLRAGSRTRWISLTEDNFGFCKWFYAHAHELARLGVGAHFGEWWGQGIQRGYGLTERRFSLFNTARWSDPAVRPSCCHVVPWLGVTTGFRSVSAWVDILRDRGSFAAPGFMRPEGVVAFHTHSRLMFKATLENDDVPKSMAA